MRHFFAGVLALLVGLAACAVSEARELPEVVWTQDVYGVDDAVGKGKDWHLLTDAGRKEIAAAITRKLEQQSKAGKLPFRLAVAGDELNAEIQTEAPISIVPIVVTDSAFHARYNVEGKDYHKYVLVSAVDVTFCSTTSEGTLQLLGNIPLHFYTELPTSNRPEDMRLLSKEEQQQLFAQFTVQMIEGNLDFAQERALLKNIEERKEIDDAYQVVDVAVTSQKARDVFESEDGSRLAYVKKVVSDVFSSAYARRTGHVVYPSRCSGDWTADASQDSWRMTLSSPLSGEKVMVMKAPQHPITLDITGIAKKEVETKQGSNINGFMGYKAWLAKSLVEGKEEKEVSNTTHEEFLRIHGSEIEKGDHDIFRMLLIGAAVKLGDQKIK